MMAAAAAMILLFCSGRSFIQGDLIMAIFALSIAMCFVAI